jgi:hypothetical protein
MPRSRPFLQAAAALVVAAPLLTLPAAALDIDLVVQMPLAVVEVEETGYPADDLALLASGLVDAELPAAEVIDVLRWAPVAWYVDELLDGDLAGADLFVDLDAAAAVEPRRLRLIEDRDGRWLLTTREDLVFLDLDDPEIDRRWVIDDDDEVFFRDRDLDPRDLDGRGLGATVQWLHARGLRGTELADAIHAELRRRGVPAGPKGRLDGPPPASSRFVVAQLPVRLVVDRRTVDLRDDAPGARVLPPGQAKKRLAEAPPLVAGRGAPDRARDDADRGRGQGGGPPAHAGPKNDRGPKPGAGRDDRGGGPPAHAGADRGRGRDGGPRADRGSGGGRGGGPKADRGGGGGNGKDKGQGRGGGGGKGKGGGG